MVKRKTPNVNSPEFMKTRVAAWRDGVRSRAQSEGGALARGAMQTRILAETMLSLITRGAVEVPEPLRGMICPLVDVARACDKACEGYFDALEDEEMTDEMIAKLLRENDQKRKAVRQ